MPDYSQQIDQLHERLKNALPTPMVGETVVHFRNGDVNDQAAAVVTRIEDFGKVSLTVFPQGDFQRFVEGCYHISHPDHKANPNNPNTRLNGAWDYPSREKPTRLQKEAHINALTKQLEDLKAKHTPPAK